MPLDFFGVKSRPAQVLASAFVAGTVAVASGLSAAADDPGYVLTQKSTKMGDQYVYVSPQGLKITNPTAGFNIVTRAPAWDITIYNDKTKCFYQTTADHYRAQLAGRSPDGDFKNSTWAKSGDTTIHGLKATEYRMGSKVVHQKTKSGAVVSKNINGAQYWVATDIAIPAQLTQLLAAAYGLPAQTSTCVPLRLQYSEAGAPAHLVLDTYRVQSSPIPVAYFNSPVGYKLVTSDAEVMMNDEQKQIMNDMARDMSDPKDAALKNKIEAVRTGGASPANTFTKDDVNKLMDIFSKKK